MQTVTGRVLGIGAIVGVALALLTVTDAGDASALRLAMLPLALAAVIGGLLEAVALGRAEWQRARPTRRDYARTVALFVAGLVLTVLALS
jgi:energy-converting hydrogenase Eha subunit A